MAILWPTRTGCTDMNGDLVNLYKVVKDHMEEFVSRFKWELFGRVIFK